MSVQVSGGSRRASPGVRGTALSDDPCAPPPPPQLPALGEPLALLACFLPEKPSRLPWAVYSAALCPLTLTPCLPFSLFPSLGEP